MKTSDFKTKTSFLERKNPSVDNAWCVGIDIGYSGIKVFSPNCVAVVPAYARQVDPDRLMLRNELATDIMYRDNSETWVIGNMAYDELGTGGNDIRESESELFGRDRYFSPLYRILANVGYALGTTTNTSGTPQKKRKLVQMGLPPKYMEDSKYIKELMSERQEFSLKIGKGNWTDYVMDLTEEAVRVMPQPLGALISAATDKDGKKVNDAKKYFRSNLVVFDPGFETMDDYTVINGVVTGQETYSGLGMKEVFSQTIKKLKDTYNAELTIPALQKYLASGEIKIVDRKQMKRTKISFEKILCDANTDVCQKALEKMKTTHSYFAETDTIIATGGTYDAWSDMFNEHFQDMDGLAIIPANINDISLSNVFSNVRGYYFYLLDGVKAGKI